MKLDINMELRPCKVNGENALFHRWSERSVIKQALLRGTIGGVVKYAVAIVEYKDGNIGECLPEEIQFLDNKFEQVCFEPKARKKYLKRVTCIEDDCCGELVKGKIYDVIEVVNDEDGTRYILKGLEDDEYCTSYFEDL